MSKRITGKQSSCQAIKQGCGQPGRSEIETELNSLLSKIAEYERILSDEKYIKEIVKEECLKMRDKYGDERRTEIAPVSGEMDIEDLIPQEECVLTLTRVGYIKRQAADAYRAQRRGGRGIMGMTTRDEDVTETMFLCDSHDHVMFFTTAGRVYRMKCYEVPEGSRTSKGMNIVNLLPLEPGEKVTAMIRMGEITEDRYLCMITRKGIIKRTRLDAYQHVRKRGLIAIDLDEGDELAWVRDTDGYQTLLVATRQGMAIRFNEQDARVIGRTARGVKALTLKKEDEVVGMAVCREGGLVLTVTETGYGRLSEPSDYRIQSRGGKGLINYHTAQFGEVASFQVIDQSDDIILISSDGIIIRMHADSIRLCHRPAKGVRVMRMKEDVKIVSMAVSPRGEEEDGEEIAVPEETEGAEEGLELDTQEPADGETAVEAEE